MTGMIQGGWEYVQGAYALSFVVVVAYGAWMELRLRKEAR